MKKTITRKVDENGRVRFPVEILRAWGIEYGGEVILEYDETAALIFPVDEDGGN